MHEHQYYELASFREISTGKEIEKLDERNRCILCHSQFRLMVLLPPAFLSVTMSVSNKAGNVEFWLHIKNRLKWTEIIVKKMMGCCGWLSGPKGFRIDLKWYKAHLIKFWETNSAKSQWWEVYSFPAWISCWIVEWQRFEMTSYPRNVTVISIVQYPAGTRRNDNVIMTSKRRRDVVLTP